MPTNKKTGRGSPAYQASGKKQLVLPILSFVLFVAFIFLGSLFLWQFFARFEADPQQFKEYLASFGFWGAGIFILMQVLQVVFPIIPGEVLELGAGYVYGPWLGLLLCQIGTGLASVAVFFVARRFGRPFFNAFVGPGKLEKLRFLHNQKKLSLIVFILFFIPGTPKDLLTYFIGLTKIKVAHFIAITLFARIPSVLSSTLIGASFGRGQYLLAVVYTVLTVVVSIFGLLYYRKLSREDGAKI